MKPVIASIFVVADGVTSRFAGQAFTLEDARKSCSNGVEIITNNNPTARPGGLPPMEHLVSAQKRAAAGDKPNSPRRAYSGAFNSDEFIWK